MLEAMREEDVAGFPSSPERLANEDMEIKSASGLLCRTEMGERGQRDRLISHVESAQREWRSTRKMLEGKKAKAASACIREAVVLPTSTFACRDMRREGRGGWWFTRGAPEGHRGDGSPCSPGLSVGWRAFVAGTFVSCASSGDVCCVGDPRNRRLPTKRPSRSAVACAIIPVLLCPGPGRCSAPAWA